ncbi:hypothetical protein ARAM_004226 [Aspergillus rambellii]|uniref:C6 finger domain protein n=1 Tax=Aspergillus rambellii TaxID=308745 RepID=A0A0F8U2T0_9EURO|nr:hypothetical protein ARAM_004226 [Aspergillus rambellii]
MEQIRIPPPSSILDPLPTVASAGRSKVPTSTQKGASAQTATFVAANKPKQSKSRNGKPTLHNFMTAHTQHGGIKPPLLDTNESLCSQQSSPRNIPSRRSSRSSATQKDLSALMDQLLGYSFPESLNEDDLVPQLAEITPPDQSPWLSDLLFSSTTNHEHAAFIGTMPETPHGNKIFSFEALLEGDDDEIEEITRLPDRAIGAEIFDFSEISMSPHTEQTNVAPSLSREPVFSAESPEMLVLHFDRSTCGILSVKDGIHENPWRTLVWPLAKDTPALHHAIFALAAFHSSKENPSLRVHGVNHMRQSITCMVQDIQSMRADSALATSLALAFADTWDQHTRTCIQHLRGAKALVSQVVEFGLQGGVFGGDLSRVRFLYNTWQYMDVIARLTSREENGEWEFDAPFLQLPDNTVHEIDPLMGCATTLFPLINQVARLIQRVRQTESNSISLISQAIELKRLVEQWEPSDLFEPPEDPTSEVQHSIQTAHAYRWATLLYLHQAVPEMPSEPASLLAKRVLILLATVPPSSRTTIIQMFPLLVAGCETDQEEDRNWVLIRWSAIQSRLMLGSIDRCIEVVREVWARRDANEVEKQRRQQLRGVSCSGNPIAEALGNDRVFYSSRGTVASSRQRSAVSSLENIEFDRTVRGRLHWVYVMQEWGWEVFIG